MESTHFTGPMKYQLPASPGCGSEVAEALGGRRLHDLKALLVVGWAAQWHSWGSVGDHHGEWPKVAELSPNLPWLAKQLVISLDLKLSNHGLGCAQGDNCWIVKPGWWTRFRGELTPTYDG